MSVSIHARRSRASSFWFVAALAIAIPIGMFAQAPPAGGARGGRGGAAPGGAAQGRGGPGGGQGGGGGAAAGARGSSPVDLTGYWVSIVTEDYIERMFPDSPKSGTPQAGRGGGGGGAGRGGGGGGAASAAAPADPCRVYGAGGSMRLPGRLNITWADDNTLKIDMDSGTQTRLFHFGAGQAPAGEKSLQGYSVASWDSAGGGGGRGGPGGGGGRGGAPGAGAPPVGVPGGTVGGAAGPAAAAGGRGAGPATAPAAPAGGGRGGAPGGGAPANRWASLTVTTTNMKGGYLLTSRSAYSENATLTEYFNKSTDFGVDYLTVVAIIADGGANHTTSSTFKKEPNGSKFSPSGCDIVK